MKHIQKGIEPEKFTDWKGLANEDWQPTYDDLSGDVKKAVKDALKAEQGSICCYCERRLQDDDSHIEHFRPQSNPSVDPLDFSNLLCSCQNQIKKGVPRHCGNLKDNWFDETLLISPFNPDCEQRFSFTQLGEIKPRSETDEAAQITITKLGLDISKLNAMRKAVIEPFLDETLTETDLQEFVSGYLKKDAENCYGEFWSMIRYNFAEYVTP
jgi:uncharacterized protein (TIGR02646 family)